MRLVVLASRIPFPLDKGDKLRLFHQLSFLSKHHEICLICLSEDNTNSVPEELNSITSEIHFIPIPKWRIYLNLILAIFNQTPFQVAYFKQRNAKKKISEIIKKFKPNHIYCQLIRTAYYALDQIEISKSIDYMDALSKAAERRSETSRFLKKIFWTEEAIRVKKYEAKCFLHFQNHFVISDQDKSYLNFASPSPIIVIPNGVHLTTEQMKDKICDVLFVGNMSYPPNIIAAELLAKIAQQSSNTLFHIAGVNPNTRLLKLEQSNFKIVGGVPNVFEYYAQAKIFVAPMTIGAGMQNKILEAMASSLPVITTSLAANAFQNLDESAVIIEDDFNKYPEIIQSYLIDEELRKGHGKKNLEYVSKLYSWNQVNEILNLNLKP
ncbi:MAG: glycosyltransferase [Bacteroidota bacterium]